jgi:type VI secretion system protein
MSRPERILRDFLVRACFALLVSCAISGCASAPPPFRLLLEFVTTPRLNQNSPVPISLVAINDQKLFERLVQMNAKQWFEAREQIRRDNPGDAAFSEWVWEYVPGQAPPPVVIQVDGRAVGALIFANYRSPGDHRVRLGPQQRMRIDLGDDGMTISPLEAPVD